MQIAKARRTAGVRPLARPLAVAFLCAGLLVACSDSPEAMLGSAKDYIARKDFAAASIQLKNALQKNDGLVEARYLLGTLNLEQGDVPGALKELRRAAELGHSPTLVAPPLARAMVLSAQFEQVIKEFDGKTLDDPAAQARLLAAIGDAHLARANVEAARTAYQAAMDANSSDPLVRVGRGRVKLFSDDAEGALAEADAALALDPKMAEAHVLKADVSIVRKRVDDAVASMDAAIALSPSKIDYHFSLISLLLREERLDDAESRLAAMEKFAKSHPMTRYLRAFVDFNRGRLTEARDGIAKVVAAAPDFLPAQLLAGGILFRMNDQVQAQAHLNKVLERAPQQTLARRTLVLSLLASRENGRALDALQPLLDADANDSATLMLAGQTYLANGDFDRAAEYFGKVAAAEPANVQARTRLGMARMAGGEIDRAFADLEAASALNSEAAQADVALILAHLNRSEPDRALAAYAKLERKQPDKPQTYNIKGGVLLAKQDRDGARKAFEKALSLQPDFLSAAVNLARLDLADKKPQDAVAHLEKVVGANPSNADAHLALADMLIRTGAKPEVVESNLRRGLEKNPTALTVKLALARHLVRYKDFKQGLALAQEAAAAAPASPPAIETLGQAQMAAGNHQQAISSFGKLVTLLPQSPLPLIILADAQRSAGDVAGAEQALRRALAIRVDLPDAEQRLMTLLVGAKRMNEATTFAQSIQKRRPADPMGFVFEGGVHAANERWDDAVVAFRKAMELKRSGEAMTRLHAALVRAGRGAEAESLAADWLRKEPRDAVARAYLAERALADKRYQDADRLYRELLALRADNVLVLNNLAWVAGQLDDPGALDLAKRANELAPENAAVLDTLGMLQVERGERDKGVESLRRALDLAPEAAAIRLNLARAYLSMDRKDDARREIDIVIRESPDNSPIKAEATAMRQGL